MTALCDPMDYYNNMTAITRILIMTILKLQYKLVSCYPKLSYREDISLSTNTDSIVVILVTARNYLRAICRQQDRHVSIWVEYLFAQSRLIIEIRDLHQPD